ncbi:hypothetical protein J1N35_046208 [Gossypium stocksii]|uniref:Uncharacterized protein n=1 Tax=Gossypium stocksii TaxID=47602 RepID=A0A9D3U5A6_9ROSI|nr:hypothetical protein J1N35_046208 [Gossypium stocksii]
MVVFESVASPFGLSTKLAATAAEYLLTLEFELVPALTIKDSVASPFASQVFCDVLSQLFSSILAGKSQSRGLFVLSFSRSRSFYLDLLKNKGTDVASSGKR